MRSPDEHKRRRKPDLKPYTSASDERLHVCCIKCKIDFLSHTCTLLLMQWLETDFLGYLKEWEDSVNARTDVPDAQKPMMLLSRETIEGLHITGNNTLSLEHHGFLCLLFNLFSQVIC